MDYQMSKKENLTIVIPVYNSAEIFPILYKRLVDALENSVSAFDIIAVVDGCKDASAEVITNLHKQDKRLRLIEFSRNFGHQAAVTAGLQYATGDMIVIMDDDLEDPPEIIPLLIAKAKEGYDVVYGVRKKRKVSIFLRISYHIFYRFMNKLATVDMPYDTGDFCLISRRIVDKLNSMPETNRYIRGLRAWIGFKQTGIEYERDSRYAGESGYSLFRYIKFAIDGMISFSYKPLQYISLIGFLIAFFSFAYMLYLIISKLLYDAIDAPGWASLMTIILFSGGLQLVSLGITGQYIARIYDEVKQRPLYIIKRYIGFNEEKS